MLLDKIKSKEAKIAVLGMGYVGFPLAKVFCDRGFFVWGLDTDCEKISLLNSGNSYFSHVSDSVVQKLRGTERFFATNDVEVANDADVVIMCVPTPLTKYKEPDMRYIVTATESVAHFKKQQLIVLESTTYPGTVRELVKPILERGGRKSGRDFLLAYSPEREDPGNPLFATHSIPKVVGAECEKALKLATILYSMIVPKVVPMSSLEAAEAVKLTENIFRFVNISLINELKMIFQNLDIDIWEVVNAAATKPFGYMPFYPGPGIGGHCIPIDPIYLNWKIRCSGMVSRFIDLATQLNEEVTTYVVNRVAVALDSVYNKGIKNSKILLVGIAYKKNVNDYRESPAMHIMKKLIARGAVVRFHDPFVNKLCDTDIDQDCEKISIPLTKDLLESVDLVLICAEHDVIDYDLIKRSSKLIVDTRNVIKQPLEGCELFSA